MTEQKIKINLVITSTNTYVPASLTKEIYSYSYFSVRILGLNPQFCEIREGLSTSSVPKTILC